MGDIKLLLREAVPVDDVEPDLVVVADRVRQRRRRRIGGRVAAVGAALAVVLVAGTTTETDLLGTDGNSDVDVATGTGTGRDGDPPHRPGSPTEGSEAAEGSGTAEGTVAEGADEAEVGGVSDAAAFTQLLADRNWVARTRFVSWPVQPSDFVDGRPEPGIIVVGTLTDVRPGAITPSTCVDDMGCVTETHVETEVRVDRVLPGDQAHPDEMMIPWVTGDAVHADEELDELLAIPFTDAAPIGARVLVFLRPTGGDADPYEWRPVEPSGIVIEDADGVAIPRPGSERTPLDRTFDEYLAEVGRLLSEQQNP